MFHFLPRVCMLGKEREVTEVYIQTEGPRLRRMLLDTNPLLRPDHLADLIPAYREIYPFRHGYRLWGPTGRFVEIMKHYFQHTKVFCQLSGLSAGGKDAARGEMERLAPGFTRRLVTATSRPPKSGERDGVDYYFYPDAAAFGAAVAAGEFIEYTEQGGRWYGLPKRSVADALVAPEPFVVTHVEMFSGWPQLEACIAQLRPGIGGPFALRVVILPEMTARAYFEEWLPAHRPASEVESRANRAAVEIWEAPRRAGFLMGNVMSGAYPTLTWEAGTLLDHMTRLLPPEIHGPILPERPDLGVGYLSSVAAAQDTIYQHRTSSV